MQRRQLVGTVVTVALLAGSLGVAPAWAAFPGAGGRIAYQSGDDIWSVRADGTFPLNLTDDPATDEAPEYSPDGTEIAFGSTRDGGDRDVFVMSHAGANVTALTTGTAQESGPHWSPDGSKIAYTRWTGANTESVWVMNADGSGQALLYDSGSRDFAAEWSPDGSRLLILSNRTGNFEVYVYEFSSASLTDVSNHAAFDGDAVWAPDGSRIGFFSDRSGRDIWTVNPDGTGLAYLAPGEKLAWSPDGSTIAHGNGWIVTIDATTGGGDSYLTPGFWPDWQPTPQPEWITDLALTATTTTPTVQRGAPVSVQMTVTASPVGPARDVSVSVPLPDGFVITGSTSTAGTCSGDPSLVCAIGPMSAGASETITIEGAAPAFDSTLVFEGTATTTTVDADPWNDRASTYVFVRSEGGGGEPGAYLTELSYVPSTPAVAEDETFDYVFQARSRGNVNGAFIGFHPPSDATVVSVPDGCSDLGSLVECFVPGPIADGSTVTLTLGLRATEGLGERDLYSWVSVNPSSPMSSAETFGPHVTVGGGEPDPTTLALAIEATPGVVEGHRISYGLTTTNSGTADAHDVAVDLTLPAGAGFVSAGAGCVEASGVVTCSLGLLEAGRGVTRTVEITAPDVDANTMVHADAVATGANASAVTAGVDTPVQAVADLEIAVTAPVTATEGDDVRVEVAVRNTGDDDATRAAAVVTLPSGLTFASAAGCAELVGIVTCDLGTVADSDAVTIEIDAMADTVAGSTPRSVTATASSDEHDPDGASDGATVTVNDAPVAPVITDLVAPGLVFAGPLSVTPFSATWDDERPDTWTTEFDFGDGTTEIVGPQGADLQAAVRHFYSVASCTLAVEVRVTDALGGTDQESAVVSVGTGGFLPPMSNQALTDKVRNKRILPVKVSLVDCAGAPVGGLQPAIRFTQGDATSLADDQLAPIQTWSSVSAADTNGVMRDAGDHYLYNLDLGTRSGEWTVIAYPFGSPGPSLRHVLMLTSK